MFLQIFFTILISTNNLLNNSEWIIFFQGTTMLVTNFANILQCELSHLFGIINYKQLQSII